MKSMTIVVKFKKGESPTPVTFGDKVLGSEVTGLASYDLMHTSEIAVNAIESSYEDCCLDAKEAMDKYIVDSLKDN
jgi:hypothetical protein